MSAKLAMHPSRLVLPSGLMSVAVQHMLATLGMRMRVMRRREDRDRAAIFDVTYTRKGSSTMDLAVPYCSYEGRTVLLSALISNKHGAKPAWYVGGRPRVGTRAIAFFPSTEECLVRWSTEMHADHAQHLRDLGFTVAEQAPRVPHRRPQLSVRGKVIDLPSASVCCKLAEALSGGSAACSPSDLDEAAATLELGFGVTHARNECSLDERDAVILLPAGAELVAPQPRSRVPRLRLAA